MSGVKVKIEGIDMTSMVTPIPLTPLEHAHALYLPHLPDNAVLSIEETDGKLIARYIFRLTYTSAKSRRTLNMVAKGESLPTEYGELYNFYLRQIVLSPSEVAREFSRLYFYERNARQDMFLNNKNNIRVSGKTEIDGEMDGAVNDDQLTYKDYA